MLQHTTSLDLAQPAVPTCKRCQRSAMSFKRLTTTCNSSTTNSHPPGTSHYNQHYQQLLNRAAAGGCPALLLAPMENLMERPTRIALQHCHAAYSIGSFDEACTEFIRVPANAEKLAATVRGITASYDASELGAIVPLAAQLMGSNAELLVATALHLVHNKGAPRIDLNCGCPANIVTGGGAGSSLLKDPSQLHNLVAALVAAVGQVVPVSVKMRSGFDDTHLFKDNLLAVQEAGASFVTVHPRTKQQSYNGRADWSLIALAKQLLHIPVVGNGDVICVNSAVQLWQQTGCDGIMVGRGALQDPFIFHRVRSQWQQQQQQQQRLRPPRQQQHQQQQLVAAVTCQSGLSAHSRPHSANAGEQTLHQGVQQCETDAVHVSGFRECDALADFLHRYASYGFDGKAGGISSLSQSGRIGRLKKVMKYLFSGQPRLREACNHLLRAQPGQVTADQLLDDMITQVRQHWQDGGPPERYLVSHMTMPGKSKAEQTWQQQQQQQATTDTAMVATAGSHCVAADGVTA